MNVNNISKTLFTRGGGSTLPIEHTPRSVSFFSYTRRRQHTVRSCIISSLENGFSEKLSHFLYLLCLIFINLFEEAVDYPFVHKAGYLSQMKIGEIIKFINRHPFMSLFIICSICFYWPQSIPKVYSDGTILKVERGITYRIASGVDLDIYPFMIQTRLPGAPKEAGVSQSIYYVTRKDLEKARAQYQKNGGCWPATFSSYQRQMMVVGDNKGISKYIKKKGPPPLYGAEPQFLRVKAYNLIPHSKGESESTTMQIISMRNADLVSIQSVWKANKT